jgi:hypothetical protein
LALRENGDGTPMLAFALCGIPQPATPAGAISLLRFVAELIEGESLGDDDEKHYAMAIRNVADFFERSTSA